MIGGIKAPQVADGVYLLDEGRTTGTMASCVYLVVGERAALVETGPTVTAAAVIPQSLRKMGIGAEDLSHILLTHIHLDHSGAAGYLSQLYPRAQIVMHRAGAAHMIEPTKLLEGTTAVFGQDAEELYGKVVPVPAERVLAASGGEMIDLGGGRVLEVVDTPGHAAHHLAFWDARTRGIFSGEALGIYSPELDLLAPAAAPPTFDPTIAIPSARRLAQLAPERVYHSHMGVQENAGDAVDRYIDAVLTWAEIVREAMKEDPSYANVSARLQARIDAERRAAALARGIGAPTTVSVALSAGGFMGFFKKAGLDVDLSGLRRR